MKSWLVTGIATIGLTAGVLGCNTAPVPTSCLDAAKEKGVPAQFLEYIERPEGLNMAERLALKAALNKAGVGEICDKFR